MTQRKNVVFITGAASGVGWCLTQAFVREGYQVVATDIDFAGLKARIQEQSWSAKQIYMRKLDVSDPDQWQAVWASVLERWGQVDVLLNVAGFLKPGYIAKVSSVDIDRHIDINVKGLMYGSQLAASTMSKRGAGHIINIASLAGVAPIPGIALYSASKFAVRGFTLALAQELKPSGVHVSVICPDAIETPMLTLQEDYEEAALTFSGSKTLTVDDIADAVFNRVLKKKTLEVTLPDLRGWVAKMGSAFPSVSFMLSKQLGKHGRKKQLARTAKNT